MPDATFPKRKRREEVGALPVITLVVWVLCSAVGWIGTRALAPVRLLPPPTSAPVIQTTVIDVTLEDTPADMSPANDDTPAPADEKPTDAPPAPPAAPVAAPSPLIAFAQPIEGPVRIISAAQAAPTRPLSQNPNADNTVVTTPPVQRLTLGVGEGRQPRPDYPEEARIAHQHGTVVIRFNVDENGTVTSAQIIKPTPFPLLNEVALDKVRNDWHFATGPPRCFEFTFDFNLKQQ